MKKRKQCKMCWNCCHFEIIYGLPIKYIKIFLYLWIFLFSECAARFNKTNQNPFELTLINFYYNTINNTIDQSINIAPSKLY